MHFIKEQKQNLSNIKNTNEKKKRKTHDYNERDKVLVKLPQKTKYGSDAYTGPCEVTKVHSNGTLTI